MSHLMDYWYCFKETLRPLPSWWWHGGLYITYDDGLLILFQRNIKATTNIHGGDIYVFLIHYIIIIQLFQRVVDDHGWWSYLLQGAAAGIIIIGVHQHAWSALCNKHMNTKNETKCMAQGRINTKSGHNKFYLVFPFLLSVLKYGTEFFIFWPSAVFCCSSHVFTIC